MKMDKGGLLPRRFAANQHKSLVPTTDDMR